jgi:hypothetical protein
VQCRSRPRAAPNLLDYVDNELDNLVTGDDEDAKPTAGFQRVIQRAVIHVQSSGREEVTGANVLVAIFAERESHAAYFLQEQDMTRYDAVNYISHGIAKRPGGRKPPGPRARRKKGKADQCGRGRRQEKASDALDGLLRQPQREGRRRQDRSADRPHGEKSTARSRSCAAGRRTIRCSSAIPVSARRPSPRALPSASSNGDVPEVLPDCDDLLARHGRAAGRHALSRRFRRAPEAGGQGARGLPGAVCSSTRSTR